MSRPRPRVITKAIFGAAVAAAGLSLLSGGPTPARGNTPYFQGFETDTSGWSTESGSTVTRYASNNNSSPVGPISAANGGYYAVITNVPDAYQTGYGVAGYSFYGGASSSYPGPFTQSVSAYVSTGWAAPSAPGTAAFWIDTVPSDIYGNSIFGGGTYNPGTNLTQSMENDFAFFVPGNGDVTVAALDDPTHHTIATITQSGWYTFAMSVYKTAGGYTGESMTVYNGGAPMNADGTNSGGLVAGETPQTFTFTGDPSYDLGGNGYVWFTVWQNGFNGNDMAIDNVQTTPEPATLSLLALGGLGLLARRRRRKVAVT